ncbi:MAG: 3-dehydroquinate synthase [Acidobacteriales bacterium]|nr:3-dehydroquinate synthase [Terriglobales bacterium]
MQRIQVRTSSRQYNVVIGDNALSQAGSVICRELRLPVEHCIVLSSQRIWELWGKALGRSLDEARVRWSPVLIPDGEEAKRLATLELAAERMLEERADRRSLLIAFGGGVIGDIGGFLASAYMRGIRFVQIPTTLLAQVDASIGGKTGVNLAGGKNLLGAFHQPECVVIDPHVLSTLDEREFRAGMYEVIKCGAIADSELFSHCERHVDGLIARGPEAVLMAIEHSVQVKANIVSQDERETGLRRILNYGHTIGHAIEAVTGYSALLHGEAVAWGMIAAAHLARISQHAFAQVSDRIERVVLNYAPPPLPQLDANAVVDRVAFDKKTVGGANHFIFVPSIGHAEVVSGVARDAIFEAVAYIQQLASVRA